MDQLKSLQQQSDHNEARYLREKCRTEQSITAASDIGKSVMNSPFWMGSCNCDKLYNMLDVEDSTVHELSQKLIHSLPRSWAQCMQQEIEERARDEPVNNKRKKPDLPSKSADSSPSASQPLVYERQIQLSWGYVLRQLKQVGAEHAHWHLIDTSQSRITGHSGKVDFSFSASQQRAWPQVVALAEVKKDLQTQSQHIKCLGQLTARAEDIFTSQPHRKYVMMVAGGLDGLEVFAFFRTGSILRSGLQAWAFHSSSYGLRWLCKLLFSSQAAMGFVPELLPFMTTTPHGLLFLTALGLLMNCKSATCRADVPIQDFLYWRSDAPTTSGPGHACKVFQAKYGVKHELVAVKVGASAKHEVSLALPLATSLVLLC